MDYFATIRTELYVICELVFKLIPWGWRAIWSSNTACQCVLFVPSIWLRTIFPRYIKLWKEQRGGAIPRSARRNSYYYFAFYQIVRCFVFFSFIFHMTDSLSLTSRNTLIYSHQHIGTIRVSILHIDTFHVITIVKPNKIYFFTLRNPLHFIVFKVQLR